MNFKYLNKNEKGRDFICADIHGHFSILKQYLSDNSFDPTIDRLLSLGDLIDRGEESPQVLEWLELPWFHAIQGNHERMLIDAVESRSENQRRQWFMWGGNWAEQLSENELENYYQAIVNLPAAMEVEISAKNNVGLVHAELPDDCDWLQVKRRLENAPRNIEDDPHISNMFWTKSQPFYDEFRLQNVKPVKNIHHVFHGHSILSQYKTIRNRTFMDLGSYKTGKIGFIEPVSFLV